MKNNKSNLFNGYGSFCTSQQGYSKTDILKLIPRHKDFSGQLKKQIENIPEIILKTSGSPIARKINGMIRELFKELDRQRQFTRTILSKKGILSGKIACQHRVEDWVLNYFHIRFPDFTICLFNERTKKTWVINNFGQIKKYAKPFELIVQMLSSNREDLDWNWAEWSIDKSDYDAETLFTEFYSSQFIKKRENRRYFQHMIPKKMHKHPGLRGKIENSFQNTSLDIFTKSSQKSK